LTPSFVGAFGCLFEAIGFAVNCDDLGVVDKAIDQGSDAGCGGEDLSPFGERAIGGHQGANPNSRHNSNNEVVMAPTEIFGPEFECHFHHRHFSPSSSHEIRPVLNGITGEKSS
jgi:hypothetical protein